MEIRKEKVCPAEIQKSVPEWEQTPNKVITNRLVFLGSQNFSGNPQFQMIYASEIIQLDYIQA